MCLYVNSLGIYRIYSGTFKDCILSTPGWLYDSNYDQDPPPRICCAALIYPRLFVAGIKRVISEGSSSLLGVLQNLKGSMLHSCSRAPM